MHKFFLSCLIHAKRSFCTINVVSFYNAFLLVENFLPSVNKGWSSVNSGYCGKFGLNPLSLTNLPNSYKIRLSGVISILIWGLKILRYNGVACIITNDVRPRDCWRNTIQMILLIIISSYACLEKNSRGYHKQRIIL